MASGAQQQDTVRGEGDTPKRPPAPPDPLGEVPPLLLLLLLLLLPLALGLLLLLLLLKLQLLPLAMIALFPMLQLLLLAFAGLEPELEPELSPDCPLFPPHCTVFWLPPPDPPPL